MGYRHAREDILAAAVSSATDEGVSGLSFGRVARRLGVSDRVVVYYFPTRSDLVAAVLAQVADTLAETLAQVASRRFADHRDFLGAAWPVLTAPESDPAFALFFESLGLAVAGHSPYDAVVPRIVTGWVDWVTESLDGPPEQRRREAETAVALVDGLLLLRAVAGAEAAERAAVTLGVAEG